LEALWFHALVLMLAAATMWWGSRHLSRPHRLVLWSFVLVQPAFELVFSLRQPVFLSRTLLWILLAAAVLLGLAWDRAEGRRLMAGAAVLLLGVGTLGTVGYHTEFQKTEWDEAASLVASHAGPDDVVFVLAGNTLVAFNRYFDDYDLELDRYRLPWGIPDRVSRGSVLTDDDVDQLLAIADDYDRVWLVLNSVGNIDGGDLLAPTLADRLTEGVRERFVDVEVVAFD
jgi:hypothetical protein